MNEHRTNSKSINTIDLSISQHSIAQHSKG